MPRPLNDQFEIPTFDEIVALAKQMSAQTGRTIHLYPETKHPTYFQSIGLPLEDRLVDALLKDAYTSRTATVYIQSFEVANLKAIRNRIKSSQPNWKLVQLMDEAQQRPSGGSDSEQQRDGDFLDHDARYARTDEYLGILRRIWTEAQPFDHDGAHYRFKQGFSEVKPFQQPHVPIYFGGASEAALAVAGKHADVYALWGESLD
ncbi:LLM class flavin-dependent oxidoreductase, partial [Burkholderia cenocepacia]|nr:LLM class flavin-dependent oxidoreductase [Burkholderia cenocepacia]MDR5670717.1 LLM class flavin-dependent oxidoreductase [Burkholderia cenocepacia]